MKKTLKLLFVSFLSVMLLVACGGTGEDVGECEFTIGVVLDMGGVSDQSFNQSAWEGANKYADEELKWSDAKKKKCLTYMTAEGDADYVPNITKYANDKTDVIIVVGYLFADAMEEVPAKFPDAKFLFIDGAVSEKANSAKNVTSTEFAQNEGSYLVGLIAGKRAKETNTEVGFVGGMTDGPIEAFQAGYEAGVLEAYPEAIIHIEYVEDFRDPAKGQTLATKLYDKNVSVIYHAAGDSGNGVIKIAKERDDVWVIGVDKDQYDAGKVNDDKNIILTSMIKSVDKAVFKFLDAYGTDKANMPEMLSFGVEDKSIYAEVTAGRNLTDDEIKMVDEYAAKIVSGEIVVPLVPTIGSGQSNK